ncbi:hypothetical protein LOZ80_00010 [Paenibacillus sp. HWE-109]|uniref:hypothetical protein n=1 Tax=Paenibacillus sp. HWE-109 TaxID=1306526 RepID=UPI001EDDAF9E|nr:hypothetical protein [Paenibacillus sp. HWE-109]UKS27376.1 hypothetical protein LOZ80_00010 [Paenibacillus sp. HWE-109]
MDFWIQTSSPNCTGIFDEDDQNLSNAIETIFPMMTEKAIMVWKTIYIPLCYKYDISCMIDDILEILEKLRSSPSGEISVNWASNTFANVWHIRWLEEQVEITSEWGSVLGHTEQLLDSKGAISLSKQSFISEWKRVLFNIISGLQESGYNESNLPDMTRLKVEYNAIQGEGILYK